MSPSRNKTKSGLGAIPGTKEFRDRYLDKQEVLQTFNISSRTLQNWRTYNEVTFIRIGNKTYYLKESLDNLIAGNTILSNIQNDPGPVTQEESLNEKDGIIPADTITPQPTDISEQKSFTKLWEPIPWYLVPIVVILIYFIPFAEDIIKGQPIDPFVLVLPLKIGAIGFGAFFLLQLGIRISRKYIFRKKTP
jgi:hypothetical protein